MTPAAADHQNNADDLARTKSAIGDFKEAYDRGEISGTNLDRAMRGLAPIDEHSAGVLTVDQFSSDDTPRWPLLNKQHPAHPRTDRANASVTGTDENNQHPS